MKKYINKTTIILTIISVLGAIVYGYLRTPFYLNFINGLTIIGVLELAFGLFRYQWIKGDFTFFSWHPTKRTKNRKGDHYYATGDTNPSRNRSYREYREYIQDQRKDKQNPALPVGGFISVIALILSFLY